MANGITELTQNIETIAALDSINTKIDANNKALIGKSGYYETAHPKDRYYGGVTEIEGLGNYMYDYFTRPNIKNQTLKYIQDFQDAEINKLNYMLEMNPDTSYSIGNLEFLPDDTKGIGIWGSARTDLRPLTSEDYFSNALSTLENIRDAKYYSYDRQKRSGGHLQLGRFSEGWFETSPDTAFVYNTADNPDNIFYERNREEMIKTIFHEMLGHGTGLRHHSTADLDEEFGRENYVTLEDSLYNLLTPGAVDTLGMILNKDFKYNKKER